MSHVTFPPLNMPPLTFPPQHAPLNIPPPSIVAFCLKAYLEGVRIGPDSPSYSERFTSESDSANKKRDELFSDAYQSRIDGFCP